MWVPLAPASGLWYPRHELRDPVAAGDLLGEIRSVFGEVLASIHSKPRASSCTGLPASR